MANRYIICKGKKSDSSSTCDSNHVCQNDIQARENENNINPHVNDTVTTPVHNKQNYECYQECTNCKLLNRLYILLEEIVKNRSSIKNAEVVTNNKCCDQTNTPAKNVNKKKKLDKNTQDEITQVEVGEVIIVVDEVMTVVNEVIKAKEIKESQMTLPNVNLEDNLIRHNCENSNKNLNSNFRLKIEQENLQNPKIKENVNQSSAQDFHSVEPLKQQEHADCACQCNTCLKKDSCTQGTKHECMDSAVNTETPNNHSIQNIYSILNNPNFHEAMKLTPFPHIVILSNGFNLNPPVNRTSVTTNTSETVVVKQDKSVGVSKSHEPVPKQLNDASKIFNDLKKLPRENSVSFSKNISQEKNNLKCNTQVVNPTNTAQKSLEKIEITNNKLENTTFPQDTQITVASSLVSKISKRKTPKSKKRKKSKASSSNEKKNFINTCCQTDKNAPPKVEYKTGFDLKDASTCCQISNCASTKKITEKETVIENQNQNKSKDQNQNEMQNLNNCQCTDIKKIVEIIANICTEINKTTKEKLDETIDCACTAKNKSIKSQDINGECLEIHRLAEKIAEIQLKSNQNKSSFSNYKESNDLVKSISNCDLSNCVNLPVQTFPSNSEDYCDVCPCKKSITHDKKEFPVKKEKRYRSPSNCVPKQATRKLNDREFNNINKWTLQYPSPSEQNCNCTSNYECLDEKEIGCVNYDTSGYSKDIDNCHIENCPELKRIMKNCLCGTKKCYCRNAKFNDIKTTAKLERLADEVISVITPCSCMEQQCTCGCKNTIDPLLSKYNNTKQIYYSTVHHKNQKKLSNDTVKNKKLFGKDFNGNPCLNGSKSETNVYLKNIINTKTKNKTCPYMRKVIPSAKKLKPFILKPLLPIPETVCPQVNYINSLFPEIYQVLSKIKQLTNWQSLPQEIVEIVIDKILKREIKNALQQMKEGVIKVNKNGDGDQKQNANILNILLDEKLNSEEYIKDFKNNILDKLSENINQSTEEKNTDSKEECKETINLMKDNNSDEQKNFDLNKNPILVQINIEKEKKPVSKKNKTSVESSLITLNPVLSSSSIYITENKLGSIKDLITLVNEKVQKNDDDDNDDDEDDDEDDDDNDDDNLDSSSILSLNKSLQPISININIDTETIKNLNTKDNPCMKIGNTVPKDSLLSIETIPETTEEFSSNMASKSSADIEKFIKLMNKLKEKTKSINNAQEMNKITDDVQEENDLQDREESNYYHKNKNKIPTLDNFLTMNKNMKVIKSKILPKKSY